MKEFDNLLYEVAGDIATITVDRPDKLNALSRAAIEELGEAVHEARDDEAVRGVLVTGSGEKAFVAGADIGELSRMDPLAAVEVSRHAQGVFREIELSRKPYVAAVNGFALGGGCELGLACHLRVAAISAKFGFPEVGLGLIPGYGGTARLPRIIGRGRALELILTGEVIDASEAHRIGLVNRLAEPQMLLVAARDLLRRIISNAPIAVAFAAESITRGAEMSLDDSLALESSFFGMLAATADMREGLSAFLAKRPPEFRGS